MASRFLTAKLTTTAKTFFAKTLSLSLPSFRHLSLSTTTANLSHRPSLYLGQKKSRSGSDLVYYCATAGLKSDSMNELLDWFDNETMEANDTNKKLRKEYETIIAKLLAEDRAVLVEDKEDLHDFSWELQVKHYQAYDLAYNEGKPSFNNRAKTVLEHCRQKSNNRTESERIVDVWEYYLDLYFHWFEIDLMKAKETTEKLRKDYEMISQKLLLLANDDEEKVVLVEELNEMFSNLSKKKAKAIRAKAKAAKALDHKAKAADLLSCFFVF